jgi:hypothetical protein
MTAGAVDSDAWARSEHRFRWRYGFGAMVQSIGMAGKAVLNNVGRP